MKTAVLWLVCSLALLGALLVGAQAHADTQADASTLGRRCVLWGLDGKPYYCASDRGRAYVIAEPASWTIFTVWIDGENTTSTAMTIRRAISDISYNAALADWAGVSATIVVSDRVANAAEAGWTGASATIIVADEARNTALQTARVATATEMTATTTAQIALDIASVEETQQRIDTAFGVANVQLFRVATATEQAATATAQINLNIDSIEAIINEVNSRLAGPLDVQIPATQTLASITALPSIDNNIDSSEAVLTEINSKLAGPLNVQAPATQTIASVTALPSIDNDIASIEATQQRIDGFLAGELQARWPATQTNRLDPAVENDLSASEAALQRVDASTVTLPADLARVVTATEQVAEHFPDPLSETWVYATSVAADTYYYPAATGTAMAFASDLSCQWLLDGTGGATITLTFEGSHGGGPTWVDVTKAGYELNSNSTGNTSFVAASGTDDGIIDYDSLNLVSLRAKVVVSAAAADSVTIWCRKKAH